MSTPISTLPLKTQQANSAASAGTAASAASADASYATDINDPIVQDVLNEFQEELKQSSKPYPPMAPLNHQMPQSHASHASHHSHASHPPMPTMPPMMYPPQHPSLYSGAGSGKHNSIASYLDIEVAKRSLILVIVSLIIYHSGIINVAYEKMPDYLQDNLTNFDIYIKSASLFAIIYVLSFFEYI